MKNEFLLDKKEISCILINLFTVKMLFTNPRSIFINSGNAAWLQLLFVSLIAILIYYVTINIYKRAGTKNIFELFEHFGGKSLKIVMGLILTVVLLLNVSISMRAFPESIKTILLPLTPMQIILPIFLLVVGVASYMGIYSISRIHALFMPISGITLLFLFIFLIPHIDINNLFPVFSTGTYNIFINGLDALSIFSDICILFILIPFCKSYKKAKKSSFYAILISSSILTFLTFLYCTIFSYPASGEFIFPIYQMTRLIRVGDFFQRLESFFEFVWSISMFLYASLYLFTISYLWGEIFDLKNFKPLIYPFAILMGAISFIPSSMIDLMRMEQLILRFTTPILFLIPIIAALGFIIKNKKVKSMGEENL